MTRLLSFLTLSFSVLMLAATPAKAEAEKYEFDKAHTQILFFADHLGFSKSSGKFLDFDGYYMFDEENPENSSIDVTIQTDSINMDMEKWDDHLKNEDFFNVAAYPQMTFKSTDIEVTGEDTADITGDLTLLGITKPVILQVKHNKTGEHPRSGKKTSGFSATAMIDRSEWGMAYGVPMMDPMTEIRIEVEASVADEAAAAEEGDE